MNKRETVKYVKELVYVACQSDKNSFKSTVWKHHVLPVVKFSLILGKKLHADLFVLELAAYLHDYASFSGHYTDHHFKGAKMAGQVLLKKGVAPEIIKKVQNCVLNHRASIKTRRKSVEERIIASADAMAHISELADMFYLTFNIHGYSSKEGSLWLKAKLKRSWQKIIPEGRKIVKGDYEIALKILDKATK